MHKMSWWWDLAMFSLYVIQLDMWQIFWWWACGIWLCLVCKWFSLICAEPLMSLWHLAVFRMWVIQLYKCRTSWWWFCGIWLLFSLSVVFINWAFFLNCLFFLVCMSYFLSAEVFNHALTFCLSSECMYLPSFFTALFMQPKICSGYVSFIIFFHVLLI